LFVFDFCINQIFSSKFGFKLFQIYISALNLFYMFMSNWLKCLAHKLIE